MTKAHVWRFFRAGGFHQVRIDRGSDVAALPTLDQKLWVALACPTRGIEFDERTLDLIDIEHDGRIRAPEVIAAVEWTVGLLKDPDELIGGGDSLPIASIQDGTDHGRAVRSSAETILTMLGKKDAPAISLQDTADVQRIYAATPFNGDGIVTPASAQDEGTAAAIADIMATVGTELDRGLEPGVSSALIERFFDEANAFAVWQDEADKNPETFLPLHEDTGAAATLLSGLTAKIDDYFARIRLAEFDQRAGAALNAPIESYEALSPTALTIQSSEISALPLAVVEAGKPLSLKEGLNPAWAVQIGNLQQEVVLPLLGNRDELTEADWTKIKARLEPYSTWIAQQPQTPVATLGITRVRALLVPEVRQRIEELVAKDKALEPQMSVIADVEKLVRMKRDLVALLNNFVSFKDFYTRSGKATFQAGTLYLDGRSCDLCIEVGSETTHAQLASLSRIYLAYCRCTRVGGKETMTIAAGFTAGDAENLMVGRNGVFYDRKGRDWDATIVKIVEHPISLRQAFWLPYRQAARFINEQIQKMAAARSAMVQSQMGSTVTRVTEHSVTMPAPAPAAPPAAPPGAAATAPQAAAPPAAPTGQQQAFDAARFAGIFAAIGLAIGAIGTAFASVVTGFLQLAWWQMPLAILGVILLISGPSCLIAALKLQSRNLGPILDASGWAVNTKLKINLPFGRALTQVAQFPERSEKAMIDPYAEKRHLWLWYCAIALVIALGLTAWWYGVLPR